MILPRCLFCDHENPGGAKFCNDCGSPLHLKPCKLCDAVNDRGVKHCYKCRVEFEENWTLEGEPLSLAHETSALNDLEFDRRYAPNSGSRAEDVDLLELNRRAEAAENRDDAIEVAVRERHSLREEAIAFFRISAHGNPIVPMRALAPLERRRPVSRESLVLVLTFAFGALAVAGNYVHRDADLTLLAGSATKPHEPAQSPADAGASASDSVSPVGGGASATAVGSVALVPTVGSMDEGAGPANPQQETQASSTQDVNAGVAAAPAAPVAAPDIQAVVPAPEATRTVCTEGVVALGLCKPGKEENK